MAESATCRCVQIGDGLGGLPIIDTTDCPLHPVKCEAICAETGIGCHHDAGHDDGDPDAQHSYVVNISWRSGQPAESVIL